MFVGPPFGDFEAVYDFGFLFGGRGIGGVCAEGDGEGGEGEAGGGDDPAVTRARCGG